MAALSQNMVRREWPDRDAFEGSEFLGRAQTLGACRSRTQRTPSRPPVDRTGIPSVSTFLDQRSWIEHAACRDVGNRPIFVQHQASEPHTPSSVVACSADCRECPVAGNASRMLWARTRLRWSGSWAAPRRMNSGKPPTSSSCRSGDGYVRRSVRRQGAEGRRAPGVSGGYARVSVVAYQESNRYADKCCENRRAGVGCRYG
jgi:hypothetical protein